MLDQHATRSAVSQHSLTKILSLVDHHYADNAAGVFQSVGLKPELCDGSGAFADAMDLVYACTSRHLSDSTGIKSAVIGLNTPLSYCSSLGVQNLDGLYSSYRSTECASYASLGLLGPSSLGCVLTLCQSTIMDMEESQINESAANGVVQSWNVVTATANSSTAATLDNSPTTYLAPSTITAYTVFVTPKPTSQAKNKNDLSTGAIAGTAVGATVVVMLLLGLAGWFIWRHRHKRKKKRESEKAAVAGKSDSHEDGQKAQLHSDDCKPDRKELEGSMVPLKVREIAGVYEIEYQDLSRVRSEMSANEIAASELDRSNKTGSSTVVGSSELPHSNVGSEVKQVQ